MTTNPAPPTQFLTPALGPLPPVAVTMLTRGPTSNRPAGKQFIRLVTQALARRVR
ncbi:MAG TPA: hypothetical protein VE074_05115 [Jatrophihabitantaceae bacterium]|nr:hypothetical protein [Jatrophihabitantaceae bacterium]